MTSTKDYTRGSVDRLTARWWLYLIMIPLFFIPSYATREYDPKQVSDLIEAVVRSPLINAISSFFFVFKMLPIVFTVLLLVLGDRIKRLFYLYAMLLFVIIGIFQNSANTEEFGLVVVTSNVVYLLIAALAWLYALTTNSGSYAKAELPIWKWPFFALAVFAFWFPVDESTTMPRFSLSNLVSNSAMVTACMAIPVILSIQLIFYPRTENTTLRITGFVGVVLGAVNVINWFIIKPSYWWIGVLHIPLAAISILCFILGFRRLRHELG